MNANFFLVNEFLVLEKKTFQKVIYHVRAVWAKVILLNHVLNKILKFHLVSWCGNFVETHIALRDWVESPETLRKFHVSTKYPRQYLGWNYGILYSDVGLDCITERPAVVRNITHLCRPYLNQPYKPNKRYLTPKIIHTLPKIVSNNIKNKFEIFNSNELQNKGSDFILVTSDVTKTLALKGNFSCRFV